MKIEVFKSKGKKGEYYYHLKSRNGRILCVSEGYTLEKDCVRAAKKLIMEIRANHVKLVIVSKKLFEIL